MSTQRRTAQIFQRNTLQFSAISNGSICNRSSHSMHSQCYKVRVFMYMCIGVRRHCNEKRKQMPSMNNHQADSKNMTDVISCSLQHAFSHMTAS